MCSEWEMPNKSGLPGQSWALVEIRLPAVVEAGDRVRSRMYKIPPLDVSRETQLFHSMVKVPDHQGEFSANLKQDVKVTGEEVFAP